MKKIILTLIILFGLTKNIYCAGGWDFEHADPRIDRYISSEGIWTNTCVNQDSKFVILISIGASEDVDCKKQGFSYRSSLDYEKEKVFVESKSKEILGVVKEFNTLIVNEERKLLPGFLKKWKSREKKSPYPLFFQDYERQYIDEVFRPSFKKIEKRVRLIK